MVLNELKQRHIEPFAVAINANLEMPIVKYRGEIVRAAIASGWVKTPEWKVSDVSGMAVPLVRWLAEEFTTAYTEVMTVDPKLS